MFQNPNFEEKIQLFYQNMQYRYIPSLISYMNIRIQSGSRSTTLGFADPDFLGSLTSVPFFAEFAEYAR